MLKLIYFSGCPRVEEVRTLLKNAGIEFVEICQEDLPIKHPLRGYSSPTVLAGPEIIIGSQTSDGASACSIELPRLDELQERLKAISAKRFSDS